MKALDKAKRWIAVPKNQHKAMIGGSVAALGLLFVLTRPRTPAGKLNPAARVPVPKISWDNHGPFIDAATMADLVKIAKASPQRAGSIGSYLASQGPAWGSHGYLWNTGFSFSVNKGIIDLHSTTVVVYPLAMLPLDASAICASFFGKEWQDRIPANSKGFVTSDPAMVSPSPVYHDPFGRQFCGDGNVLGGIANAFEAGWSGLSDAAAVVKDVVKSVTDNPLWSIIQTGVSFVPGIGTAVSVGMSVAYAYGHDISLKDAALNAARAAIPGGPAAQAAFDVAVGLAEGKSVDDAALSAARNQLPAGVARTAFDQGVAVSKGKKVSQAVQDGAAQAAQQELAKRTGA